MIERTLPGHGASRCRRTGRCRTRRTGSRRSARRSARRCATPARTRPRWWASAPTSPPAPCCRCCADGTPLCELPELADAAARLGQAVEAPRRAAAGRPDQRPRPRARRAVDRPLRRADLLGVAVRQGAAAARGGPGDLPADRALDRGGRLDHLAAVRPRDAQRLHRRLQGDLPGRPLPVGGATSRRSTPDFADFAQTRLAGPPLSALGSRAGALTAAGAALDRAARGHRGRRRQRRRARHRARGPGHQPGQMLAIMGTSTCHVMNGDALGGRAGHLRRGGRRDRRRDSSATRPGRARSATSSPGGPASASRRATSSEAARARPGPARVPVRAGATGQPVGAHGLVALDWMGGNRSILVDHHLSGVIAGLTLATTPEEVYRALLEATAFGTRVIVEAFEAAGVPVTEFIVGRRAQAQPAADADLRRRAAPAGLRGRLRPGARRSGSAIHAAVAAGPARRRGRRVRRRWAGCERAAYLPDPARADAYDELFAEYRTLHDYFSGRPDWAATTCCTACARPQERARRAHDEPRSPRQIRRGRASRSARCTRSSSATGSSSGPRATSRPGSPARS